MSCQKNGNKAGTAGLRAGIGALTGKAGNVAGSFSNRVLNTIDRDSALAKVMRNPVRKAVAETVVGVGLGVAGAVGVNMAIAAGPAGWAGLGTAAVAAAGSTRINPDRQRGPLSTQTATLRTGLLKKQKQVQVPVYRDKKRPDRRVFSLGEVNYEIRSGQDRGGGAYTQLVSKTLPREHYYFKGTLSDRQAVGIAAGTRKAEKMPGYGGQVSYRETLVPSWATLKHSMIRASLAHQGPNGSQK